MVNGGDTSEEVQYIDQVDHQQNGQLLYLFTNVSASAIPIPITRVQITRIVSELKIRRLHEMNYFTTIT